MDDTIQTKRQERMHSCSGFSAFLPPPLFSPINLVFTSPKTYFKLAILAKERWPIPCVKHSDINPNSLKDVIHLPISIEAWGEHPKQPSYRSYPRLFSSSFENALNPPALK
jgi:hypothetical protein